MRVLLIGMSQFKVVVINSIDYLLHICSQYIIFFIGGQYARLGNGNLARTNSKFPMDTNYYSYIYGNRMG